MTEVVIDPPPASRHGSIASQMCGQVTGYQCMRVVMEIGYE